MTDKRFGWGLPPGVRVSDIPGNRPEDIEWETIMDQFFDKKRVMDPKRHGIKISEKEYKLMDQLYSTKKWSQVVDDYIVMAIEYGRELVREEAKRDVEIERYYKDHPDEQDYS